MSIGNSAKKGVTKRTYGKKTKLIASKKSPKKYQTPELLKIFSRIKQKKIEQEERKKRNQEDLKIKKKEKETAKNDRNNEKSIKEGKNVVKLARISENLEKEERKTDIVGGKN